MRRFISLVRHSTQILLLLSVCCSALPSNPEGGREEGNDVTSIQYCVFVSAQFASLVCVASFCRIMYRYVELKHPVYGILFQCVLVQLLVLLISTAALLVIFLFNLDIIIWIRWANFSGMAVRQLYEITWACVSHLRYFSIVKKGLDDQNVDFLAMRKRYLILVWVLLVSQFIFTFAVGISVKKIFKLPMAVTKDMSVFHRFLAIFPLHLATTIPDIYSIAIYLKIRTYSKKQDKIEAENVVYVLPHGGIYVGEDDSSVGEVPAYQDNDSKERKCVLVALMTYNWTCLLDFVAVGLFIFLYEHILFQLLLSLFLSYLIPLVTIGRNFGKLRSIMLICITDLLSSLWGSGSNQVYPNPEDEAYDQQNTYVTSPQS